MQALAAGRLQETQEPKLVEQFPQRYRAFHDSFPVQSDVGVEIEGQPVRRLDSLDRRSPGMDLENPDLHEADETGEIFDIERGLGPCLLGELEAMDRRRHAGALVLLKEALVGMSFRTAQQAE